MLVVVDEVVLLYLLEDDLDTDDDELGLVEDDSKVLDVLNVEDLWMMSLAS